jgi:soluble cytochrome b562
MFVAMSAYIENTERSQMKNLMLYLKLPEKQEQAKPKTSRRREIIKIKPKINEIETKKYKESTTTTTNWFIEKINKIDKPLANLTKMRREITQISKIRNKYHENPGNHQGLL